MRKRSILLNAICCMICLFKHAKRVLVIVVRLLHHSFVLRSEVEWIRLVSFR